MRAFLPLSGRCFEDTEYVSPPLKKLSTKKVQIKTPKKKLASQQGLADLTQTNQKPIFQAHDTSQSHLNGCILAFLTNLPEVPI